MKIGAHLSTRGSFPRVARRAHELGLNCLQSFSRNPRGGRQRLLKPDEIVSWNAARRAHNIEMVCLHGPYTLNLASNREEVRDYSIETLAGDLRRSAQLDVPYLIIHPGAHTGAGLEVGVERIAYGLNRAMKDARPALKAGVRLLLELMSGAGSEIGSTPRELAMIRDRLDDADSVGICVDTCHSFVRGYPLHTSTGLAEYIQELDCALGLESVKIIHLNDARAPFNSRKDGHEKLGDGHLGEEALTRIINHPALREHPFILEVPVEDECEYKVQADWARARRDAINEKDR